MLTGFAFLNRLTEEYINKKVMQYGLTELGPIPCGCGAIYRLFAKPSTPRDEEDARSDIKDLTDRANHIIFMDCPTNVAEGQPKRPGHVSSYEFLESGQVAT